MKQGQKSTKIFVSVKIDNATKVVLITDSDPQIDKNAIMEEEIKEEEHDDGLNQETLRHIQLMAELQKIEKPSTVIKFTLS